MKGTLVTAGANVRMPFVQNGRQAGSLLLPNGSVDPAKLQCLQQWVRAYSKDAPRGSQNPDAAVLNPLPGPTLRARVGDLVELTFLNLIDPLNFPRADLGKCDEYSTTKGGKSEKVYPIVDQYPDCFNESIYTNVHFHGTHTNPQSTGDNVFLQVAPSPRSADTSRTPAITAASVQAPFDQFFRQCEAQLPSATVPKQWPRLWSDLVTDPPLSTLFRDWAVKSWKDHAPGKWVEQNEAAIANGAWPQNWVGAYPYCYRLPDYTPTKWPPDTPAHTMSAHTGGAGAAEMDEAQAPVRPLMMGQAPGTHWYHAHKHGSTTINVSNGMTGVFVIEGKYDDEIKAAYPGGIKQQVMVIQQLGGTPFLARGAGGADPYFSVNGQLQPVITMRPGEVQWWRIANTAGRAGVYFRSPQSTSGPQWRRTAQDGVQFNNKNYTAFANASPDFLLASGNRTDILIQAPAKEGAYPIIVNNSVDAADRGGFATKLTLLTIKVTGTPANMQIMSKAPSFPPYLADIEAKDVKATRTLVFSSSTENPIERPAMHKIDGKLFDGEVGAAVVLNQTEEWKVVNETYPKPAGGGNQISHPFHIHINPFQISELFDPNEVADVQRGEGTVTTTEDSHVVNGSGTRFKTQARVGDFILIQGENRGTILSIESDTRLTFSNEANEVSNAPYEIGYAEYTIDKTMADITGQCYIDPDPKNSETWKPCKTKRSTLWNDVYSIPSGRIFFDARDPKNVIQYKVSGYFKMRSRFVDYAGYYVLHCHILAHEDRGMMTVVYVTPLQPPFSHH
jgi:FtsP/CotA-like multicopper oxidase with cupredoxin domain